ncbi:Septin [Lachnellula occidentalis]|uniref:Septin n=1 Tax=Lachnellula occidentalis TaxID=215460 RepID=A0A8H8RM10_9HELO|nr:Septin [Lachnellula occidentalis]
MRPLPGEDAYTGRSRSTSFSDNETTPLATRNQPPQMTYFLADEKTMEGSLSHSYSPSIPSKQRDSPKDSTYGVESLESTISSISQDSDDSEDKLRHARRNWKRNLGQPRPRLSDEDLSSMASESRNASPSSHQRLSSQATISRPFTPLSFGSPAPPSLMSSPGSRRASDAGSFMDEVTSQAIASSGDEERDELVENGSAPQLVMPSVGKTSLIKSIVQICEDIVHVDPLSPTPISIPETRKSSRSKSRSGVEMQSTSQITEIYASTRAYPAWWSDLEESRILRRRKSLGDSVLERNLCFVDTPGYGNKTSCLECITPVVDYIESHFQKATSLDTLSEPDMISMLSGNGGSQVDLVLYVITQRIRPTDIEYLRRLSHLTNIIPILSQTDILSSTDISTLKENITSELSAFNIRTFQFGPSPEGHQISSPYAISTTPSKDHDTMDASLLMSPDYVSPLVPSDLHTLVSQIFEPSSISWLRHSAAKKFITWRDNSSALTIPQSLSSPTSSFQSLTGPSASYALARINDHTQREERLSQIRLANWAADLQRSLQNERIRFETLARNERAVWLTEKLGECVQDGSIVPVSETGKGLVKSGADEGSYCRKNPREAGRRMEMGVGMDKADPLGLLHLNAEMKRRGWVAVRVMGGFGILGGLAWWVVGTWQGAEETRVWGVGVRDWLDFGVGMGF